MSKRLFCIPIRTEALNYCSSFLKSNGIDIANTPSAQATHLLLPAPLSINELGFLELLNSIPKTVTVIGGNLDSSMFAGYRIFDLLKNEEYLAKNAAITAACAVRLATQELPITLIDAPILILGWGRIGKCLAMLLSKLGCSISVAARKEKDLAIISALGFHPVTYSEISAQYDTCRILFNTVPAEILPATLAERFPANCLKIDLASRSGIGGSNVIWARGLPGKMMPESSGRLIGETVLSFLSQEAANL